MRNAKCYYEPKFSDLSHGFTTSLKKALSKHPFLDLESRMRRYQTRRLSFSFDRLDRRDVPAGTGVVAIDGLPSDYIPPDPIPIVVDPSMDVESITNLDNIVNSLANPNSDALPTPLLPGPLVSPMDPVLLGPPPSGNLPPIPTNLPPGIIPTVPYTFPPPPGPMIISIPIINPVSFGPGIITIYVPNL